MTVEHLKCFQVVLNLRSLRTQIDLTALKFVPLKIKSLSHCKLPTKQSNQIDFMLKKGEGQNTLILYHTKNNRQQIWNQNRTQLEACESELRMEKSYLLLIVSFLS